MPIELLSFPVQSGKTTWLQEQFGQRSDVFGFLTPGDPAHRVLRLLPSGTEVPYAAAPGAPAIEIGRFRLNPNAFHQGLEHLMTALDHPECRILLVDELGPLEVRQNRGFAPGIDAFIQAAKAREDVVTFLVIRDFLLEEARQRWQLHAEPANRPELFEPLPPRVGLVLAGGESRRMGRDKAFLLRSGIPAYAHTAALLAPHCETLLISGPQEYPPFEGLPDAPEFAGCGPLSGVLSAAQRFPDHDLFVLGVDYPDLKPEALQRLTVGRMLTGKSTCFRQAEGDGVEPLVAIYRKEDLAELRGWFAEGRESLRKFLEQCAVCALPHDPRLGVVSVDEPRGKDLG